MTNRAKNWQQATRLCITLLCVSGAGIIGCGKADTPAVDNDLRAVVTEVRGVGETPSKPDAKATPATEPVADPLHQPFAKAARLLDDTPVGCAVPDKTVAGKSVYKIYRDVLSQWDGIRFTTAAGKRIQYTATVVTALGELDIELRPDLAPNHVRSFVALARAGYYDALFFDRVNHEEYPDKPGVRLDTLEAGCPTGTGEDGFGSVGYWLYPESQPSEKATHGEGTVGACRCGIEKDSAACKFYINLSEAPFLDTHFTIFGQVTRGLDVAKKVFAQPVIPEDRGHYGLLHPERPVLIQKVLIRTHEGD